MDLWKKYLDWPKGLEKIVYKSIWGKRRTNFL